MIEKLLPFQRRFLKRALADDVKIAILSVGRGNGKSALVAHLICNLLVPGQPMFRSGKESVMVSGSIEQSRTSFLPARNWLEEHHPGAFSFTDSARALGIRHKDTNTRLRVASSNSKTLFGLGANEPFLFLEECGTWEPRGGTAVWDAIETSLGKNSECRVLCVGTIAPSGPGYWYGDLIAEGTQPGIYVDCIQGDKKTWSKWPTIQKANPVLSKFKDGRTQLLRERDKALKDSRLEARFKSFRLNLPTRDESEVLLSLDDVKIACRRPTPPREGKFICGIDLGGGRSWSASVGCWQNGRVEVLASCPGVPSVEKQEERDRVGPGVYQRLVAGGQLRVATGLRVQPPSQLIEFVLSEWGRPSQVVCDRFRLNEMQDCGYNLNFQPRVSRWSEASQDIRDLRRLVLDGPFSIAENSRDLIMASLATTEIRSDDQGNFRISKTSFRSRDDISAAWVLAAGGWARAGSVPKSPGIKVHLVG